MATFVLVHGAWHGGWCWQRVVRRLGPEHTVYAPTLTGLGDRSHLLSPAIDVDTHISDIVNLLIWEDLTDVVLCGHSYGGFVVTGVADALGDRLHALVYLDAFVPSDGDSGPSLGGIPLASADMPPPPAAFFGLSGDDAKWVEARMTAMPAGAANQSIRLHHQDDLTIPRIYVQAQGWDNPDHFTANYFRAQTEPGWTAITLAGSHDLMIDRPDEVAALLRDAAR